ncbi:MAG: tRNA (adenosine(37)-N6)-dimethylallyltransferase MiaA [Clostridiales bacterium]|nr:tRNA (adenosine(37)-N6)-dimethylallyltransferase MiaA [Clostridiales bacterium]
MGKEVQKKSITYFIAGATATGKTKAAIDLALLINGEVVSADSMQIYKYMNIGTAKPTMEEMRGVPHHCVNLLYPDEECSAARFKQLAQEAMADIKSRDKPPIVVGGSGFYLNALLYNTEFAQIDDAHLRLRYMRLANERGSEHLHDMLKIADPFYASSIHPNNVKRVARALAFYHATGSRLSEHNAKERSRNAAESCSVPQMENDKRLIILDMPREQLYDRINLRVDSMFEAGLVNEARELLNMGYNKGMPSMQAIGYKETADFIAGNCTESECRDRVKRNTRNYAKRQITWFKNRTAGIWKKVDEFNVSDIIN